MKRLRELGSKDPDIARAVELLETERPVELDAARVARIRARVLRPVERRSHGFLFPALVATLLVGLCATASARYGRSLWLRFHSEPVATDESPVHSHLPSSAHARPAASSATGAGPAEQAQPGAPASVEAAAVAPRPAPAHAPVLAPAPGHKVAQHVSAAPQPSPVAARLSSETPPASALALTDEPEPAASPAMPSNEEAALLTAAHKALRRNHDPALAGALVADYLKHFPDGVLVEEAFGLGLEAASLRRDPQRHALAGDYLRRFREGRFRAVAQRILDDAATDDPGHPPVRGGASDPTADPRLPESPEL